MSAVMTNTRRQLIGWSLRPSTAPRWRSSVALDWACSQTPSSARTPSLIQTYQDSLRAPVHFNMNIDNTGSNSDPILATHRLQTESHWRTSVILLLIIQQKFSNMKQVIHFSTTCWFQHYFYYLQPHCCIGSWDQLWGLRAAILDTEVRGGEV